LICLLVSFPFRLLFLGCTFDLEVFEEEELYFSFFVFAASFGLR
jgi:hypothetical protein